MDEWRSAQRVQERRFWSTLTVIGAMLTLTLVSSIAVAVGADAGGVGFYVQQAVLLALSSVGTTVALRRRRGSGVTK